MQLLSAGQFICVCQFIWSRVCTARARPKPNEHARPQLYDLGPYSAKVLVHHYGCVSNPIYRIRLICTFVPLIALWTRLGSPRGLGAYDVANVAFLFCVRLLPCHAVPHIPGWFRIVLEQALALDHCLVKVISFISRMVVHLFGAFVGSARSLVLHQIIMNRVGSWTWSEPTRVDEWSGLHGVHTDRPTTIGVEQTNTAICYTFMFE